MMNPFRAAVVAMGLTLAAVAGADAQTAPHPAQATRQENAVTTRAAGPFEVRMAPLATDAPVGRMSLDKTYHGDLEGTAKGEFLAAMTPVEGSAGYVAIEQVTGSLHGRAGTFMLQHSGTMARGAQSLSITVVPDSGTGELAGLTGTMRIIIEGGKHAYEFDYTLPATP
jgi:hypothetical protein